MCAQSRRICRESQLQQIQWNNKSLVSVGMHIEKYFYFCKKIWSLKTTGVIPMFIIFTLPELVGKLWDLSTCTWILKKLVISKYICVAQWCVFFFYSFGQHWSSLTRRNELQHIRLLMHRQYLWPRCCAQKSCLGKSKDVVVLKHYFGKGESHLYKSYWS